MSVLLVLGSAVLAMLLTAMIAGTGQTASVAHPDFAPMQAGVDAGTLGAPAWSGYAVGFLIIGMMWITMLIGFREGHWIRRAVSIWTIGYTLAYAALMATFDGYAAGETSIFLGFTAPAAWLVYGMMLGPWILLIIITVTFEGSYFSPADQARFDEILAEAAAPRSSATPARGNAAPPRGNPAPARGSEPPDGTGDA